MCMCAHDFKIKREKERVGEKDDTLAISSFYLQHQYIKITKSISPLRKENKIYTKLKFLLLA
jgi:hypothetical protein